MRFPRPGTLYQLLNLERQTKSWVLDQIEKPNRCQQAHARLGLPITLCELFSVVAGIGRAHVQRPIRRWTSNLSLKRNRIVFSEAADAISGADWLGDESSGGGLQVSADSKWLFKLLGPEYCAGNEGCNWPTSVLAMWKFHHGWAEGALVRADGGTASCAAAVRAKTRLIAAAPLHKRDKLGALMIAAWGITPAAPRFLNQTRVEWKLYRILIAL